MKVDVSTVINQPFDKVFAFVTNIENFPQWISETVGARYITEGPLGVGTVAIVTKSLRGRQAEVRTEIVAYELNKRMRARTVQGRAPVEVEYLFEPVKEGVKVTRVAEGEVSDAMRLAMPLIVQRYRRAWQGNFTTLKTVLETHS